MIQLLAGGVERSRRRSAEPRLHRCQFVVGPEPYLAAKGWSADQIGPTLHLSRCPELAAASVTDRQGVTWWLLGTALQSDPDRPDPLQQLADNQGSDLLDTYGSWSGRWVLIGGSEIHLDACGLIGCFYRTIYRGRSVELWASSSPALIATLPGRPRIDHASPAIHLGKGMDWYPPPASRFPDVNKLLPTQILSLAPATERRVSPRPPLADAPKRQSYDTILDTLQRNLVTSVSRLRDREESIWLPLTAGFDSRLILAAAKHADLPLTTFTQQYPLMERSDRTMPPLLAQELGYEHRFIRPARFAPDRKALFEAHTAGHCVDGDRHFFTHGQWEAFPAPALILRGGVFELGRCYFHRKFPEPTVDDLLQAILARFHFEEFHPSSRAHLDGIAEWLEWLTRTPEEAIDWRDRFYLEQRLAGWVSAIEQALDLTGYERVYLANCHSYIATVLQLPERLRRESRHHVDLIGRMTPQLLRFPFNPPDRRRMRLARRVRDEWYEFAARPRKRRYAAYTVQRSAAQAKRALAHLQR